MHHRMHPPLRVSVAVLLYVPCCRFAADVRSTEGRWVLVEYHELLMEGHENLPADQQQRLQEWFPLSGAKQSEAAKLPGSAPKHWGPGYKIRPQPPNEVRVI